MNEENINNGSSSPRVLISPLDWGLGHATRCIPIIHALVKNKADVIIAAEGATKKLLQKEFQNLTFVALPGYEIRYSASRGGFLFKMAAQVPRILSRIRFEKKWLTEMIRQQKVDAVISDNRFGLSNNEVPCIYITHQLHIETGNPLMNYFAQKIHYRFINRFKECWVPDFEKDPSLAGILSHPKTLPRVPVFYTGPLSRFKKKNIKEKKGWLVMLSGPEPQRTIFENVILTQLREILSSEKIPSKVVLVRGLPDETSTLNIDHSSLQIFSHLPANELQRYIEEAEIVIGRSGYSSVMDLCALQQKAVLVPTPGQTEQEYLAVHLQKQHLFFTASQKEFRLKDSVQKALHENFKVIDFSENELEKKIASFVNELRFRVLQ